MKRIKRRSFIKGSAATLAAGCAVDKRAASRSQAVTDTKVVRAAIHPAIGVARVGNSQEGYFVGPEVTEPPHQLDNRDSQGAIKRQAARFRLYGYNQAG